MRRASRSLTDVREELAQIQTEFTRLQKRIETARDTVADALTRIFGEKRPTLSEFAEKELIERIVGGVIARVSSTPNPEPKRENKYLREREAAKLLGVSQHTLRAWRSRGSPTGLPYARFGRVLLYSTKSLEQFMEERTVHRAPVGDSR
jgi:hypothetical protein